MMVQQGRATKVPEKYIKLTVTELTVTTGPSGSQASTRGPELEGETRPPTQRASGEFIYLFIYLFLI